MPGPYFGKRHPALLHNNQLSTRAPKEGGADPTTYLGELRAKWRALAAASLGLAFGHQITYYVLSILVPHLLKAFGWTKAQISAMGGVTVLVAIGAPIAGRLTDIFGVRRIAVVGVIAEMLIFTGFGAMTGDLSQYFWLSVAYSAFVGPTTSGNCYTRVIAEQFSHGRGLALAIMGCAPPLVGAVVAPLLSRFIDVHGWRAGYVAVAAGMGIGGVVALLLIPSSPERSAQPSKTSGRPATREYGAIARTPAFQIVIAGTLLCSLPFIALTSQLVLILADHGISSTTASFMISLYAVGVVGGRLISGLALDRFPPHIVAAIALGVPAIGLLILGSGLKVIVLIAAAVALLGSAMGAEINILPVLVMRFFRLEIYSTVLGLVNAVLAVSAALGALFLGLTLKLSGSFSVFLLLSALATILGSALFLLLGRASVRASAV